jgi:hypothetical protein
MSSFQTEKKKKDLAGTVVNALNDVNPGSRAQDWHKPWVKKFERQNRMLST